MRRSTTLIALAIFAVLPATAGAKLTRLPGTGETPAVAIEESGTALVAWYSQTGSGEAVALCRIPRGTSRCPATQIAVAWYDSRGERIRVSASRTGRRWSRARTIGHVNGIHRPTGARLPGLGGGGRVGGLRGRVANVTHAGLHVRAQNVTLPAVLVAGCDVVGV